MSNYATFDTPDNESKSFFTAEASQDDQERDPLPNLYASPLVSSALITAFGLPTLVEYEDPSLTNSTDRQQQQQSSSSVKVTQDVVSAPEFTRIKSTRLHSKSLPLENILVKKSSAKSQFTRSETLDRKGTNDNIIHNQSNTISSYTYRVRASTLDEHHLLMIQNANGDYAIVANESKTSDTTTTTSSMTSSLIIPANDDSNKDNIVPLQLLTETETVMNEEGHVPLPSPLLNPQYTSTTPALKLWPLAILVFYNVSGGPFGIEPAIRAGGNLYAIIGFCIFPLIWSLPEALVTAELGSTFQDPSAGVAWVEEAFGEKMGSLCGYLGWVSGATDNAIYPTLFLEYVTSVVGWDLDGLTRFGLVAIITMCLSLLNYTGLEIVGKASLVVCVIAMSPFVLMTIIGAPKVVPSRWLQLPQAPEDGMDLFDDDFQTAPGPLPLLGLAGVMWRPFVNNMFWNLNSFDSAASFAGETTDVKTTYPRGIFIGLILSVLSYLVPLMVAVGATDYTQSEWVDGHLGTVAVDIGGPWLGVWTIFAAGISNLALFEAELSADAFQLMGMAERGYLPKIFQKRSKYGTPTTGIIVGTLVIVLFGCADFGQLLELLNANYAVSLLMEYAAFIKLRLFRKDLDRPYRIPVPDWAAVLIAVPPVLATLAVILISNWYVYIFTFGAILSGVLFFKLGDVAKRRGWFEYEIKARGYGTTQLSPNENDGEITNESEWNYEEENRIT